MRPDKLEQHADDLIHHEAEPLGAAPALAILQKQLLGLFAARCQHGLEPLCHRAPQFLFRAGMLVGKERELGHERALIEQLGIVQRPVGGEHGPIRIAKRAPSVTAKRGMAGKTKSLQGLPKGEVNSLARLRDIIIFSLTNNRLDRT